MNLERWVRSRRPTWRHLDELLVRIERRGLQSLSRAELQELGRYYRASSADLSRVRALNVGGDVQAYLNNLVVRAHNQVYQRERNRFSDLLNFIWKTFPALVRRNILYILAAELVFLVPAVICYSMTLSDGEFAHLELAKGQPLIPEEMWQIIQHKQMWTDSAQHYSPLASGAIAANNLRVALMAFALGVTFGFGTVYVLMTNGMHIGTVFGACAKVGIDLRLLAFVAPHGILELSAIFICGGAGLLIGWSLLVPGRLRRRDAFRLAVRPAMGLFAGCIPLVLVAGLIEGFISPRTDLSQDTKIMVSMATLACLLLYLFLPRGSPRTKDDGLADKIVESGPV